MDAIHDKQIAFAQQLSQKIQQYQEISIESLKDDMQVKKNKCYKSTKTADEFTECVFRDVDKNMSEAKKLRYIGLFMEMKFLKCNEQRKDEGENHRCNQRLAREMDKYLKQLK